VPSVFTGQRFLLRYFDFSKNLFKNPLNVRHHQVVKKSYFIVINKPDSTLKILAFGKLYHPALILTLKVLRAVETTCLMNFHEASVRQLSRGSKTTLRIASLF